MNDDRRLGIEVLADGQRTTHDVDAGPVVAVNAIEHVARSGKCGRLEAVFLRLRCEHCHAEKLVAFGCKKRGLVERDSEYAWLSADDAGFGPLDWNSQHFVDT